MRIRPEAPELAQSLIVNGEADWLTEVRLADLRDEYAALAAIQLEHLLDWLTEYFLPALLEKPAWLKSLVVKDGRKEKDLTQMVSGGAVWNEPFKVKNYDFSAKCYALKSLGKPDMVRLIAGGYVKRLLDNAKVVRFLNGNHPDILAEFESIAAADTVWLITLRVSPGQRTLPRTAAPPISCVK